MFEGIKSFLEKKPTAPMAKGPGDFDPKHVAAAALMVEAARLDSSFDAEERATMIRLSMDRFKLSEEDSNALIEVAERRQKETYSDWLFTETIKEAFTEVERIEILEMIWEVTYADGLLDQFEASLMDHIAQMIRIPRDELENAQKRVADRLGQPT